MTPDSNDKIDVSDQLSMFSKELHDHEMEMQQHGIYIVCSAPPESDYLCIGLELLE